MRLVGEKLSNIPNTIRLVLQIVILIACVVSLYEFVYNFLVWSSLITFNLANGHLNLDNISISYPNPRHTVESGFRNKNDTRRPSHISTRFLFDYQI